MNGSSVPGEDGLTGLFYQKFWRIVGQCLTQQIHEFFRSSIIPDGWNHTLLSLLPKIVNQTKVQDMRPINLCSVQYTLFLKSYATD